MDKPIVYRYPTSALDFLEDPQYEFHELEKALLRDDKDEFFRLINEPDFDGYDLDMLFENESPRIATALLGGKARDIIDDDDWLVFEDDWAPLHLACVTRSPWLIKYLLEQKNVTVDSPCCFPPLHLKQATTLDLALEVIDSAFKCGEIDRPWTPNCSIYELFYFLFDCYKPSLEVIRLLVQYTENKKLVRKAFLNYGKKGKFIKVAALFLAAPELFLLSSLEGDSVSSIDELYLELNSLANKTDIEDGMLLLLEVFYLVGHKLIAYLRVDDPKVLGITLYANRISISFFLREAAARREPRTSSPDDYLLSLFKPVTEQDYPRPLYMTEAETCIRSYSCYLFSRLINRKDIDINYVNRMFPSLEPHEAELLEKAIKKLFKNHQFNKLLCGEPTQPKA